jgi:hypothetical protein
VASEHSSCHYEVSTGAKGLSEVSRISAATIGDDMSTMLFRYFNVFEDNTELRVANTGLLTRCAHRTWSNTKLNDVSTCLKKYLCQDGRDDISSQYNFIWETLPIMFNPCHKILLVSVRYIETNELD